MGNPVRCNKFSFQWRDLVEPSYGYGCGDLTWEQTFVLLKHLAEAASTMPHRSGYTAFDQLNATSARGTTCLYALSKNWEDDLRNRFAHLILRRPHEGNQAWFADFWGYRDIDATCVIRERTYRMTEAPISNAASKQLITSLHGVSGRTRISNNRYHKGAREIQSSSIRIAGDQVAVGFVYGYPGKWSSWWKTVSVRGKYELMLDFLIRASLEMEEAVVGYKSPVKVQAV